VNPVLPSPFHLIDFESVASTNDEALELASSGASDWTVVRATEQRAGRGRRGKTFASPPGNSYTSFLLRPDCAHADAPQIALLGGLAVARAIGEVAPDLPPAQCKWPNDVLIEGNKVCGILVEAASTGTRLDAVIVGIGVNLANHPKVDGVRISDLEALGATVDRDFWLSALAPHLKMLVDLWLSRGFAAVRQIWLDHAAGLNARVIHSEDCRPPLHGTLAGIDDAGALLISDTTGQTHRCVSGSLVLEDVA
jgi:BirA family transcriptional regulator, biotin operon repressor / biotin---[acetyl-CoA-carboxylase] ligase